MNHAGISETQGSLDGRGARFCIVASRYNREIVDRLVAAAVRTLHEHGADDVEVVRVPGAFEIPLLANRVAANCDAIITLGCLVRGETAHYELVAAECSRGVAQVMLDTGVPVAFGVLAVDRLEQAVARSGDGDTQNRGAEAALAALEMVDLLKKISATSLPESGGSRT